MFSINDDGFILPWSHRYTKATLPAYMPRAKEHVLVQDILIHTYTHIHSYLCKDARKIDFVSEY